MADAMREIMPAGKDGQDRACRRRALIFGCRAVILLLPQLNVIYTSIGATSHTLIRAAHATGFVTCHAIRATATRRVADANRSSRSHAAELTPFHDGARMILLFDAATCREIIR